MTNREFYTAIVNGTLTEDVIAKAHEEIEKLDARNAKRASKPSKKSLENAPIKDSIAEFLADGSHLASEIAKGLDLSVSKVSALCRQMVGDGVLTVEDVKVKGKGTQKSYSLAQPIKKRTDSISVLFLKFIFSYVLRTKLLLTLIPK